MTVGKRAGVVLLCAVCGCWPSSPRGTPYGSSYNPQRVARGIPPLPANWTLYSHVKGQVMWSNPAQPPGRTWAIHELKGVFYDKSGPTSESDVYYSGVWGPQKGLDPGQVGEHHMSLTYYYGKEKDGGNPWEIEVWGGPDDGKGYTLDEARAILTRWGIPSAELPGNAPTTRATS